MTSPVTATMSGPCVVCGDTHYALSCGGPTICPKCDCGNFDAATVMKQAKVIADLREQLSRPAQQPASPVKDIDYWIEKNFSGHARAIRRLGDDPIPGEPYMSMADAKALTREAIAAFGAPAQSPLERLPVEKLAKHFAVSVEQAQAAQDEIGFMYRELASTIPSTQARVQAVCSRCKGSGIEPHDKSAQCFRCYGYGKDPALSSTEHDETIKPHIYMPDYQAMGDCRVCGHEQDKPWHAVTRPDGGGT